MKVKAGLGYDIHRLEEGQKLFLGGVKINFPKGLRGHSDGDCLIHAIIDALLGTLGEKDIGQVFPDTDPNYTDIRSTELLKEVVGRIKEKNIKILSIDSIIIAEEPKLAQYIPQMKEILCPILEIGSDILGIKAKTNEGLGIIGRGEAIVSWAQVLTGEKSPET
ncbi:MAG: 2-C-methyl-D-erythritol 2,4-cyclodiphosphate synthase [Candidatus Aminicenantes bacterium]|nr:2-C-methyl-D-erythritol 2,4-cyclodiphosphate synthase [Candidatus Aminicenantes bacterium]MBL7082230.1 2-C-methyl-D-erythritol 2,4-cyclodiphosphate synthase [Candidatus Aminicenantes bacterium]NQT80539.1 2-C-methyl-D-erythritol 2,4-cyclodiphosphate synthase [Candidatus Aminicenantes bacterium]